MDADRAENLVVRRMEGADLERVSEIDRLSFSLPWPFSSFKYELERNPSSRCWVAEYQGERGINLIVAMAVAWKIVDEVHIATIAVHPGFRRQKIAERFLARILDEAALEGARFAFLEVREHNLAARSLYRKFGFTEEGIRPRYYSDTQEDAILMNLVNLKPGMFGSFE